MLREGKGSVSCRDQVAHPVPRKLGATVAWPFHGRWPPQFSRWKEPGDLSVITNKSSASHFPPSGLSFL